MTPLMEACRRSGDPRHLVTSILAKSTDKAKLVLAKDDLGTTPLMHAAASGHPRCLEALLAHEPMRQIRAVTKEGWTALMMAAQQGRAQCLEPLLAHEPGPGPGCERRGRDGAHAGCTIWACSVPGAAAGP